MKLKTQKRKQSTIKLNKQDKKFKIVCNRKAHSLIKSCGIHAGFFQLSLYYYKIEERSNFSNNLPRVPRLNSRYRTPISIKLGLFGSVKFPKQLANFDNIMQNRVF